MLPRPHLWKRFARKRLPPDATIGFDCLVRTAQEGDGPAQFEVALRYLDGRGVPSSTEAAATWFERAANTGHADAMVNLARLTLRGVGLKGLGDTIFAVAGGTPDFAKAASWAKRAADLGAVEGKVILATLLASGPREMRDVGAAHKLLLEAVRSGSHLGCFSLAVLLASQQPVEADPIFIMTLLQSAAEGEVPLAVYLSGVARELGFGCTQDIGVAVSYYLHSAKLGIRSGQTRAGCALMDGKGVERDVVMARAGCVRPRCPVMVGPPHL